MNQQDSHVFVPLPGGRARSLQALHGGLHAAAVRLCFLRVGVLQQPVCSFCWCAACHTLFVYLISATVALARGGCAACCWTPYVSVVESGRRPTAYTLAEQTALLHSSAGTFHGVQNQSDNWKTVIGTAAGAIVGGIMYRRVARTSKQGQVGTVDLESAGSRALMHSMQAGGLSAGVLYFVCSRVSSRSSSIA